MKIFIIAAALMHLTECIHIPKTTNHNPDLKNMEIEDYKFHIRTSGNKDKKPIVVIHGGPGGDFQYLLPLEKLADEFHILFYDQRMTGLSQRESEKKPGIEQDIEDLDRIIKTFSAHQKVILIGHSYGGMLAAGYTARHSESVASAVIIEPGILNRESAFEFIERFKSRTSIFSLFSIVPPLLKSIFVKTEDGHERYDYVMTKLLESGSGQPYQCEGISLPKTAFVRGGFNVFNSTIRPIMNSPELFTADLTVGLEKFKGKILLLSSECSFIGYDYQETFHRKYFPKNTQHILLNHTGHNFITTDAEQAIPVIRKFLKKG